jgi:leucyl-tRNA synthetase
MVLLAPAVPHIAEELWHLTDHDDSVHTQPWPTWDEAQFQDILQEIAIQVDGKLRAVIPVVSESDQEEIEQLALENVSVKSHLKDREIIKVIYIPGRILSLVTKRIG